ncbi:hypothetical protein MKX03_002449, partial [Papaver bracteatum]
SEKSHQANITLLRSDLAKVRKYQMNLEESCANLNARNLENVVIRKSHSSAKYVINRILLCNSLPAVNIHPLNVSKDEKYPESDSDYEFVSDDEKDQEDEEDLLEKNNSTSGTNENIEP